jgi:hypothetical protein
MNHLQIAGACAGVLLLMLTHKLECSYSVRFVAYIAVSLPQIFRMSF